jgi:hypothetical protein
VTIAANGLGSLEQMLQLGQIGVGIAVVNQGVEEVGCLPDTLFPAAQTEILLLLA